MDLNFGKKIKEFISNSRHVMAVSYRPDAETFKRTLKVVLIGTLILGILGFTISEIISFIV